MEMKRLVEINNENFRLLEAESKKTGDSIYDILNFIIRNHYIMWADKGKVEIVLTEEEYKEFRETYRKL